MNVWKCTERRRQRAAGPSCLSQGALQAVLSCLVEIQPRVGSHGVAHGLQDGRQEGNALTGSFPMQDFCFSVLYAHKNKEKQIFRTDQILSCFLTCFILISSELTVSFTVASSKCVLGLRCCLALSGAYPWNNPLKFKEWSLKLPPSNPCAVFCSLLQLVTPASAGQLSSCFFFPLSSASWPLISPSPAVVCCLSDFLLQRARVVVLWGFLVPRQGWPAGVSE